jgi:hypothetical protein
VTERLTLASFKNKEKDIEIFFLCFIHSTDSSLWSASTGFRLNSGFSQSVSLQAVDEAAGPGDLEVAAEHVTVVHNLDGSFSAVSTCCGKVRRSLMC